MNQQVSEEMQRKISFLCSLLPDPLVIEKNQIQMSRENLFTIDLGKPEERQDAKIEVFFRSSSVLVRQHLQHESTEFSEDWEVWEHLFTKKENTLFRTTHFVCHHIDRSDKKDQKNICKIVSVPFPLELKSDSQDAIGERQHIKRLMPTFRLKK